MPNDSRFSAANVAIPTPPPGFVFNQHTLWPDPALIFTSAEAALLRRRRRLEEIVHEVWDETRAHRLAVAKTISLGLDAIREVPVI